MVAPDAIQSEPSERNLRAALSARTVYNAEMNETINAKVSHRGQTSLPASLRRRWGLSDGGVVGVIDLGDAALLVPGGLDAARRELRAVLGERYEDGLDALEDSDLADQ